MGAANGVEVSYDGVTKKIVIEIEDSYAILTEKSVDDMIIVLQYYQALQQGRMKE